MSRRLLAALLLAALSLTACEPYDGPRATCFNLVAGEAGCDFRPLAGPGGSGGDA